jgi:hypothetical protein
VRLEGEGTFVVDRDVKASLLRGADDYRDRVLVPYGLGETARLEVRSPAGAFVLERAGAELRLGGAGGLRVAREAIDRVFGALADARAEAFLDLADAAPAEGAIDVDLVPREASRPRVHLSVGGPCPAQPQDVAVVRTTPTRVTACIASGPAAALDVPSQALVDEHLLAAHADEIEQIRLEPPGGSGISVDLARRGTGWHQRMPEDRDLLPAEVEVVGERVTDLAGARASEVRAGGAGAKATPRGRVTVTRTGEPAPEVIELDGAGPDGTVTARRLDDGAVMKLAPATAGLLDPGDWARALAAGQSRDAATKQ